jgi:hypothetical protein
MHKVGCVYWICGKVEVNARNWLVLKVAQEVNNQWSVVFLFLKHLKDELGKLRRVACMDRFWVLI